MSQAEELLNSLSETVIDHKHTVPDTDTYFKIDPYTRLIENTNYNKTVLMRGDHNSERFTFEVPRYVDGHDMSLCNRVIVHFDNVGEDTDEFGDPVINAHSDVAYMDDLRINPDNPETIISSWLIRREATQIVGVLSFSIQYQCIDEGEVTYEWNTDSYDDIEIRKSKNNGEAAVINYTNVLEQWRSQIFGAGDSVIANIATEGETQVAAVKTESANQQEAVELKGANTLATIPEDYTAVNDMAEEALRSKGDAIVREAEGEIITVADASNDYIRGLNVYGKSTQATTTGKNLLSIPDKINTIKGISFVVNEDRSVSVSGTPTEVCAASIYGTYGEPIAFPAGTYIISGGVDVNRYIRVRIHSSDGTLTGQKYADGNDKEFTINDGDLISISIYFATLDSVNGLTFYPMIRDASVTDTIYEPFTGGIPSPNPEYPQKIVSIENPTVSVCGKNLLNPIGETTTLKGVTLTNNGDGSFTVSGTSTGPVGLPLTNLVTYPIRLCNGKTYTQSIEILSGEKPTWAVVVPAVEDDAGHRTFNFFTDNQTKTMSKDYTLYSYTLYFNGDVTADYTFRVQLECNDHATEYEPYKEAPPLVVNRVLPGIPVNSGGNYTDENGQQWICDEVDLERGVLVQHFREVSFTGQENWVQDTNYDCAYRVGAGHIAIGGLCTHYPTYFITEDIGTVSGVYLAYTVNHIITDTRFVNDLDGFKAFLAEEYASGNPVTVLRRLNEPIETPLTAEEITAFKQLKTNYPNTTILNDVGAWMNAKYNVDTELFIKNTASGSPIDTSNGFIMIDRTTGTSYVLYINNGKLTMEVTE